MTRLSNILSAVLAVALVAVALESELPQRIAGRFAFWPELMRPGRDVDTVAADLQRIYPTQHADIVMLGDSLTAEADWRELLPGRDVVNRGVAGQTTDEVAARADEVLRLSPRVILLMAGTNDLMEGKTPDQIAASYAGILDRLQDSGAAIIVQPVVHVARDRGALGVQRFWYNRRNDKIAELNRRLRDLAAARGLHFLDINAIVAPNGVLADEATSDGTHLRASTYLIWAKAIDDLLAQPGILDAPRPLPAAENRT